MKKEDLEFLRQLQEDMQNGDKDYQTSPRFWTVAQKEWEITDERFAEKYQYVYSDGDYTEFKTVDEIMEFIVDFYDDKESAEYIELTDNLKELGLDDAFDYILRNFNDSGFFDKYPVWEVHKIERDTLFLTKEDAQAHIDSNRHHYNETVHTYAMTAWRSPKVERLFEILENADFNSLGE